MTLSTALGLVFFVVSVFLVCVGVSALRPRTRRPDRLVGVIALALAFVLVLVATGAFGWWGS